MLKKSDRNFFDLLAFLLKDPSAFFEKIRKEDWKPAFIFFLKITAIIAVVTPVVNFLGVASTAFSSSYQAQIISYRLVKDNLVPRYGAAAYLFEPFLIVWFACAVLLLATLFIHVAYHLMGGKGTLSSAWKAMCYGAGPCILGGFLPYISLFAAFWSLLLQFYVGPKILYKAGEGRAIIFLAAILALAFIEIFTEGTTVGF